MGTRSREHVAALDPRSQRSMEPRAESSWSAPSIVEGFSRSPPNDALISFADAERRRSGGRRALDIGCGAARNAAPLAASGWDVVGTDLSWPMLRAAVARVEAENARRALFALAPMDALPLADASADLVIAHGIWNLARTAREFRVAVGEAARVARPGAALFVFTFSRHTLPPDAEPVSGEPFVYTQFSGGPQCFVTAEQLVSELTGAGFALDSSMPLAELNLPKPGALQVGFAPVIYQAAFRRETG